MVHLHTRLMQKFPMDWVADWSHGIGSQTNNNTYQHTPPLIDAQTSHAKHQKTPA